MTADCFDARYGESQKKLHPKSFFPLYSGIYYGNMKHQSPGKEFKSVCHDIQKVLQL